jgi:hypothetical protein
MEVSHPREIDPGTPCGGGWVDLTVSMFSVEERNTFQYRGNPLTSHFVAHPYSDSATPAHRVTLLVNEQSHVGIRQRDQVSVQ